MRQAGIEPASKVWKTLILPLNYQRLESFSHNLSLEIMFPGVPRGGNSLTPWEEWGLNPRAFASDLKADSLTTRTSSRLGGPW